MLDTLSLVQLYADRLYGAHSTTAGAAAEAEGEEEEEEGGSCPSPPPSAAALEGITVPPSNSAPPRRRGRFSLASVGGVEGLAFIAFNDATTLPHSHRR